MKYLTIILLSVLFIPTSFGQQINETMKLMSKGENNAMVVVLPDTEEKVINKVWEKFMKDRKAKVKNVKKSDEVFSDNAKLSGLSSSAVDVYARVTQIGKDTEMSVWFDLGGAYINSEIHPAEYQNAEKLMNEFFEDVSQTYIAAMLVTEEKKMKDMEKASKENDKVQEKAEKDIEKFNEKIAEEQARIEDCKAKRGQHQRDMEGQQGVIESVRSKLKNQ